jgi:phosphoglycerate kinase
MKLLSASFVKDQIVLLRLDLDVPIKNGKVEDDFRLMAGMETLGFCLEHAKTVILMGHIGRPEGREVPSLSVQPIIDWIVDGYGHIQLPKHKLHVLENLRFEPGEDAADPEFAKELASYGNVFVNDAFASYHPSASTTVLPTLLPHAAGFRFNEEVETLMQVRNHPVRPLIAILGGAKLEDKLPVVEKMSQIADWVLVGGKLAKELIDSGKRVGANVMVGELTPDGEDISEKTLSEWKSILPRAKQILWNGPVGKFEDPKNDATEKLAHAITLTQAKTIIGGGDTLSALNHGHFLEKFSFVSTGGGAMLKFLVDGTLPTIEALK